MTGPKYLARNALPTTSHILEMNGDSYRLKHSRQNAPSQASEEPEDS